MTPKWRSVCLLLLVVKGKYVPSVKKIASAVEPAAGNQTENSGRRPGELVTGRDQLELEPAKLVSTRAVALGGDIFQSHAFSNLGARMAATRQIYDVFISRKSGGVVVRKLMGWTSNVLQLGTVVEGGEKTVGVAAVLATRDPEEFEVFKHAGTHVAGEAAGEGLEHGLQAFGVVLNGADVAWNGGHYAYQAYNDDGSKYSFCEMKGTRTRLLVSTVGLGLAISATIVTAPLAVFAVGTGSLVVAAGNLALEKLEEDLLDQCLGNQILTENVTHVQKLFDLTTELKDAETEEMKHKIEAEMGEIKPRVESLMRRLGFEDREHEFVEWFLAANAEANSQPVNVVKRTDGRHDVAAPGECDRPNKCETMTATELQVAFREGRMTSDLFSLAYHQRMVDFMGDMRAIAQQGMTEKHEKEMTMNQVVMAYIKVTWPEQPMWSLYFLYNDFSELPPAMRPHQDWKTPLLKQFHIGPDYFEAKRMLVEELYGIITAYIPGVGHEEGSGALLHYGDYMMPDKAAEWEARKKDMVKNILENTMAKEGDKVQQIQAQMKKVKDQRKAQIDVERALVMMDQYKNKIQEITQGIKWIKDDSGNFKLFGCSAPGDECTDSVRESKLKEVTDFKKTLDWTAVEMVQDDMQGMLLKVKEGFEAASKLETGLEGEQKMKQEMMGKMSPVEIEKMTLEIQKMRDAVEEGFTPYIPFE